MPGCARRRSLEGEVMLDPSRVAAQIVSGIGFLGAGIIITRRGAVHGLATAAAVWESAAIGMAAGSGLLVLACTVTVLHFVIVLGFTPVARGLAYRLRGSVRVDISYDDGKGVLRQLLHACGVHRWELTSMAEDASRSAAGGQVGVTMTLSGAGIRNARQVLAGIDGVRAVSQLDDDTE